MFTKEEFKERTSYKCTYDEWKVCYCPECDRKECVHREAYRRMPRIDGGLAECPRLKDFYRDLIGYKMT